MEISYSTTNIYRWINSRILGGKDFEGGGWTEVELVEVQDERGGGILVPVPILAITMMMTLPFGGGGKRPLSAHVVGKIPIKEEVGVGFYNGLL